MDFFSFVGKLETSKMSSSTSYPDLLGGWDLGVDCSRSVFTPSAQTKSAVEGMMKKVSH